MSVEVVPQESLGDVLGKQIGGGLQKGTQQSLQQMLSESSRRRQAQFISPKELRAANLNLEKNVNSLLKNLGAKEASEDQISDLVKISREALIKTGDPQAINTVIGSFVDQKIQKDQADKEKKANKGLEPYFKQGFTRDSVAGAILGGQLKPEEVQKISKENPSFAQELAQQAGVTVADLPFIAAGAAIGTLVGGHKGATTGAFVVPTFIRETANEIWKGIRDEEKFTIKKGGEAANRIINKTTKSAITGMALGQTPFLKQIVQKIPGGKTLLQNAIGEKVFDIATTSFTIGGVPPILEGRMPTKRDFASAIALTFGFESLNLPASIKRGIEEKGAKTNLPPKEFASKISEEVKAEGIKPEDIQAGKGPAIQKFNRIVNRVSREFSPEAKKAAEARAKVEEPKVSQETLKERVKEQRQLVRRAAKSPLEDFFEPEIERKKRPETLLKEELTKKSVEKKELIAREDLRKANNEQLDLESKLRRSPEAKKVSLEKSIEEARNRKLEIQQDLSDLKFEKKNLKPKPTKSQIFDQIDKSFAKIKEEISKPKDVDSKLIEKQTAQHKKAIDTAERIIKAGEFLNEAEADTFIKIKDQYIDSYRRMIKLNNETIEQASGNAKMVAKKMNEVLEKRLERAEADVVKQRDKKAIQALTKGARGAFFKNQLKNLRGDVEAFKENFFKQKRLKDITQLKTERVSKESLGQARNLGEKIGKNPTVENIKEAADKIGIPKESLKDFVSGFGKKIDKVLSKTKKGEPSTKAANEATSFLQKWLRDKSTKGKVSRAVIYGLITSMLQQTSDKIFGFKPNIRELGFGLVVAAAVTGRKDIAVGIAGVGTLASVFNKVLKKLGDMYEERKFKKVLATENPITIARHKKALRERVSVTRANKIEKAARS